MNDIHELARDLQDTLPGSVIHLDCDPPKDSTRGWLDVESAGRVVAVEWRAGQGFGISVLPSSPDCLCDGLLEGPDETVTSVEQAKDYVVELLKGSSVRGRSVHSA